MKRTDRIARLRDRSVAPVISYDEMYLYFYRRYTHNRDLGERVLRYADAFAYALKNITVCIDEDELLVGKSNLKLGDTETAELHRLANADEEIKAARDGQDSHMAIDYELVLAKGITGVGALKHEMVAQGADRRRCGEHEVLEKSVFAGLV